MGKKIVSQKDEEKYEIFVSGLPYTCSEKEIGDFFGDCQIVEIKMPRYQDTDRCRGYAHIVLKEEDDYKAALEKNKESLGGRYLDIKPAKGEKEIDTKINIPLGCKTLFIKNLPYEISQSEIKQEFSSCGIVTDIRMVRNWANKNFKGFAYLDYRDLGSVKKAVNKYHAKPFRNRKLILDAVITQQKKGFKKREGGEGEEYPEDE